MTRITIDFFEFAFLVEACIPPRPIARTMFWHRTIDSIYYQLTPDERAKLYDWILKSPSFTHSFENDNEDCEIFEARYNPHNSWDVVTIFRGEEKVIEDAFWYKGKYHTGMSTSIMKKFITEVRDRNHGRDN